LLHAIRRISFIRTRSVVRPFRLLLSAVVVSMVSLSAGARAEVGYLGVWPDEAASLDTTTKVITHLATVGQVPRWIAVDPTGRFLYALQLDTTSSNGNLRRLNAVTGAVDAVMATPRSGRFVMSRDGRTIILAGSLEVGLTVIDTTTMTSRTIPVPFAPADVALVNDDTRLFVSTETGVEVVDLASGTVVASIPIASGAGFLLANSAGTQVFQAHPQLGPVDVIDTSTNAVVATLPAMGAGMALDPDETTLYVSQGLASFVTVVHIATRTAVATITFPESTNTGPVRPSFRGDGARLYVPQFFATYIAVIDPTTNQIVDRIPTGGSPIPIAFAPSIATPAIVQPVPTLHPIALLALVATLALAAVGTVRCFRVSRRGISS
jgi:YVTN family beta-propeller protein